MYEDTILANEQEVRERERKKVRHGKYEREKKVSKKNRKGRYEDTNIAEEQEVKKSE